jgi:hypothetical protein
MFEDIFDTLVTRSTGEDLIGTIFGGETHHEQHDPSSDSPPAHDLSPVDLIAGSPILHQVHELWTVDSHPHTSDAGQDFPQHHTHDPASTLETLHHDHAHNDMRVEHEMISPTNALDTHHMDHHEHDTQGEHISAVQHDHGQASSADFAYGDWADHEIVPHEIYWNPADFRGVGHPIEYSDCWQQQTGNDCAVMAQGEIFESLTGYHLSEQELCQIAREHGLYDPETGTQPQDVGKLLNLLGTPTEQEYNASLSELADALQHNDRVIVGLNANEIWYPCRDSATGEPVELPSAGHAVWVTGIDQEPDGSIKVILCDSGTPHGRAEAVDVEDFLNAWADYGNEMVVAHQPT